MPLGAAEQQRIADEQYSMMATAPVAPAYGESAVDKAAEQGQMAAAGSASAPSEKIADIVKIIGAHTFINSNGVWMDTGFDPESMQTTRVSFLSDDYFALSAARQDLAAAFALGSRVIAISDGIAYEVVDSAESSQPIQIPATHTSDPETETNPGSGSPPTSTTPRFPCASSLLAFLPIGLLLFLRRTRSSSQSK
jgi:hypothetical protein